MPELSEVQAHLDKAATTLNASADNLAAATQGETFPPLQPAIFNLGRTCNHLLAAVEILRRRIEE